METDRQKRGKTRYAEYELERVMKLKKIVEKFYDHESGKGKRYSIIVDDEMVVPTTTDPDQFENYLQYVDRNTEEVEVRLHYGNSPHCNRHIFRTSQHTLSGVNQLTNIEEERKRWEAKAELDKYKKKASKYKNQLQEATEVLEKLKEENENYKSNQNVKDMIIQAIGFLKGGSTSPTPSTALAGSEGEEENSTVEISPANEPSSVALQFDQLMQEFNVENPLEVLKLNAILLQRPKLQRKVLELINSKTQ